MKVKSKMYRKKIIKSNKRNIITQNIQKSKNTKLRTCMKLPKLTPDEEAQINVILMKSKNTEFWNNPGSDNDNLYKLSSEEKSSLDSINTALNEFGSNGQISEVVRVQTNATADDNDLDNDVKNKFMSPDVRNRLNWINSELCKIDEKSDLVECDDEK